MFSHSTTCKALFSLANCHRNIKCHNTQNATSKLKMLITNMGGIPTLVMLPLPLPIKGTKKEKTTCNFKFLHISSHRITLPPKHKGTYSLVGCHLPLFCSGPLLGVVEAPPPPWERGRHLHHLWRQTDLDRFFITTKARNHQLAQFTLNTL